MSNVLVKDGFLVPRPGLSFITKGFRREEYVNTSEYAAPVVIAEIENPGEDDAGREGAGYIVETLRPNANTEIVAGWSGAFGDIDDTTVIDGASMDSTTIGSQESIGFTNITKDFDRIDTLVLRGVVDLSGESAGAPYAVILTFYARIGGTNYEVGSVTCPTLETDTRDRVSFAVQIPEDPSSSGLMARQWTTTDVNALEIVMELTSGTTQYAMRIIPDADGMFTDGGAYTDFDAPIPANTGLPDNPTDSNTGITLTAGQKQSVTFATWPQTNLAGSTLGSVDDWFMFIGFSGDSWDNPAVVSMVYYPTAGDDSTSYTLFTKTLTFEGSLDSTYPFLAELITGNNPDTSAAWTQADIEAGEFSLEVTSGEVTLVSWNLASVMLGGESVSANVDQLALDVCGMDADEDADGVVTGITHLFSSHLHHSRFDGYSGNNVTLVDVTNSVSFTTPPTAFHDQAILYGQIYLVNGTDATRRYPNEAGTNLYEALTTNNSDGATKITGRTVAAFANRILYGWVTDNTTVTPERIAYSKLFDGGTHNDTSAGVFDLIDTPGGVLKLMPLNEDVCTVYKTTGIYILRQTGNKIAPLVPDRIDAETGLVAPGTVKNALGPERNPVQIFLGKNPVDGFNVFMFDGSAVTPIGDAIRKELRDNVDHEFINTAFSIVDPLSGYYWLFVADRGDVIPEGGYMMNLRNHQWYRFTLPTQMAASCGGTWTLPNMDAFRLPARFGYKQAIIGCIDCIPRRLEYDITHDTLLAGNLIPSTAAFARARYDNMIYQSDGDGTGRYRIFYDPEIITGDLLLNAEAPHENTILRSIHIQYRNAGTTKLTVSDSIDGGQNYLGEATYQIGDETADGRLMYQSFDLTTPVTGRRHRLKFTFNWDLGADVEMVQYGDYPFKIEEIWVDYEPSGEDI
jgi:hypothetical protein